MVTSRNGPDRDSARHLHDFVQRRAMFIRRGEKALCDTMAASLEEPMIAVADKAVGAQGWVVGKRF
jgi:hypothetical protein